MKNKKNLWKFMVEIQQAVKTNKSSENELLNDLKELLNGVNVGSPYSYHLLCALEKVIDFEFKPEALELIKK